MVHQTTDATTPTTAQDRVKLHRSLAQRAAAQSQGTQSKSKRRAKALLALVMLGFMLSSILASFPGLTG